MTDRFEYNICDEVFIGQAKELQVVNSKRIDHLQNGGFYNGKDTWDSVVSSTLLCLEDFYKNGNSFINAQKQASVAKHISETRRVDNEQDDISWLI